MPSNPMIPVPDRLLTGRVATGSWTRPGRPAARPLVIDVLVGVPSETRTNSTFPLIIKGIRQRAEVEARERPEIGEIKVVVRYLAPELFHPEHDPVRPARPTGPRRGTILIYPYDPAAGEIAARRTPLVSVLERYPGEDIDCLDTDDAAAVAALVGKLHEAGHTRIGFASWHYPVVNNWVGRRFGGFVEAVRHRGLRFDPAWGLNVLPDRPNLSTDEVVTAAAHFSRSAGVTAWVCAADHQAYPLLRGLRSEGIRVPLGCSLTGFDGVEPPEGLPRIDSVRINHEHLGRSALTRLVNRVNYPSTPPRKIIVESQLVPGETIAAPPLV